MSDIYRDPSVHVLESARRVIQSIADSRMKWPASAAILYPADDELCEAWNEADIMVGAGLSGIMTNLPDIIVGAMGMPEMPDGRYGADGIECGSDVETAAYLVSEIVQKYFGYTGDCGFTTAGIGIGDGEHDSCQVELYLTPEPSAQANILDIVARYNSLAQVNGFTFLNLNNTDRDVTTVWGDFDRKPVSGGIFEKRRLKNLNDRMYQTFIQTIQALAPFYTHP